MQANVWRHRTLWLVLVASLAFNAGVGATVGVRAYNRYTERSSVDGPRRPRHGPRMLQRLHLTEEQKTRLYAAREGLRERHQQLGETIRAETDILADLLTAVEPNREAIAAQVNKLAELREQLDCDLVDHLLSIRQMLKPAQYEAFDKVIRHTLHRGGKGHRGPGGSRGLHRGPGKGRRGQWHRGDDPPRLPHDEETD